MAGVEMTHTDAMGILKSLAVGGLIFGGIGWFHNLIMRKLGKERSTDPLAVIYLTSERMEPLESEDQSETPDI